MYIWKICGFSIYIWKYHREPSKMRKQEYVPNQITRQNPRGKKKKKLMKWISNLADKDFKAMTIMMITNLRRMCKHIKNFNKDV